MQCNNGTEFEVFVHSALRNKCHSKRRIARWKRGNGKLDFVDRVRWLRIDAIIAHDALAIVLEPGHAVK